MVYSGGSPETMLTQYANQFSTVEIDQWFWSLFEKKSPALPGRADVEKYAASVPQDFRFSVKVPNSITLTHYYQKSGMPLTPNPHFLSVELFAAFLDSLQPLRPNLGPVMFQFEYLNKQKMSSVEEFMGKFGEFRSKLPEGWLYGLETRNPNFLNKEFLEFISASGCIPVFLQGYYMPPIFDLIKKHAGLLPDTIVIRLHGPDRSGIEKITSGKWDKIVQPKDAELDELVKLLYFLKQRKINVFLNVNNHYEGSAPLTIARINSLMGV